jgi:hypothetical protein
MEKEIIINLINLLIKSDKSKLTKEEVDFIYSCKEKYLRSNNGSRKASLEA